MNINGLIIIFIIVINDRLQCIKAGNLLDIQDEQEKYLNPLSRVIRQSARALQVRGNKGNGNGNGNGNNKKCKGLDGFRCATGPVCIPKNQVCDGKPDCRDGSDETSYLCHNNNCPQNTFRCGYGACIDNSLKCDGKSDCVDDSDEVGCTGPSLPTLTTQPPVPNLPICSQIQYQCQSGQCINKNNACDGYKHCIDGTDEVESVCSANECDKFTPLFRCAYGACVHLSKACDNYNDCADGSDENEQFCANWKPDIDERDSVPSGCVLPPIPQHGNYTINGEQPTPGKQVPPHTVLLFKCNSGYQPQPYNSTIAYCQPDYVWNIQAPVCTVQCPQLESTTVEITYSFNGNILNPDQPILPNTIATFKCKHSYRPPPLDPHYRDLACQNNGKWNRQLFDCSPICGTETPKGEILVIHGQSVEKGEFPWNVGIYNYYKDDVYKHICGGTIISPRIIISAAHCFYDDVYQQLSTEKYAVAAGKYYRDWSAGLDKDPYAQLRTIQNSNIYLPKEYRGSRTSYRSDIALVVLEPSEQFILSAVVRPACVDWDHTSEQFAFQSGNLGKVAGWGLTTADGDPSDTLKMLQLPFIPTFPDCFGSVPAKFQPYLQEDKICAGYLNGSSLCQGDSGSGLMFRNTQDRLWYLRAIVSIGPSTGKRTCDAYSYVGFTKFSFHLMWVRSFFALNTA